MGIKQSLMRKAFPIARALALRVPGMGVIARNIYKLFTPRAERWLTVHGSPLLVNIHDSGIGMLLFLRGEYAVKRLAAIREAVREGDVAVDIGANIGYFTVLLANLVGPKGKVYAFEPDRRNFNLLQRTIERNGYAHVIAENRAVSNKAGELVFYQTKSWAAGSLTPGEHVSTTKIPVVTLDDFLLGEHHVDFVKMDMDGSEPLAIQGMAQLIKRSPGLRVLAEYEPRNVKRYLDDPLDFMKIAADSGLKLTAILDPRSGRLPDLDLTPLKNLPDDAYLDLLFTAG